MRRNRKVILLVCIGLCLIAGVQYVRFKREKADRKMAPEIRRKGAEVQHTDLGRAGSNQLKPDQTGKELRVALISQLSQNKSVGSGSGSTGNNTTKKGFGQTYYKWNDLVSHSWKTLPLKKSKKGSLVPGLTREEATKAVIYTRIPKTGSRFMLDLIRSAADKNKFYMIYSVVFNHSGVIQDRFARAVGRIRPPFLLARQLFFIDFTEFKMAQPTYFSMIRDPVDRLVSSFNFNRFGDGTRNKWHKMFRGNKNLTLDDCILHNETECSIESASVTIRYFCGHDLRCKTPSDWSLGRAMVNVMRYYSVVGLTEDYDGTLKVLEKRLPHFFKGLPGLYTRANGKIKTASKKKYRPSPVAEEVLRQRLHLEYTFYNFVKSRLHNLKKALAI
ncbi:uronyl 2-sulfotransferase-like [Patiria miniata]|uniref:Uncharacterized protein n=1 Tax=Patiria miniata TaxID=46514 RepID=A0A914AMP3_PATMI|nr:uronyl 2-sulfotransferase-like [Patiria miniata]